MTITMMMTITILGHMNFKLIMGVVVNSEVLLDLITTLRKLST